MTPADAWAASGAMWLTGHADGPPLAPGCAVIPALEGAAARLMELAPGVKVDVGEVLTGRAALRGLRRRGRTSANGTCRLLEIADGWAALNLARPEDVEAMPALLGEAPVVDRLRGAELVERAELLGIPAAVLPERPTVPDAPYRLHQVGEPRTGPVELEGLRVVDLSSLWAGPLCARLLGDAGMHVVKVESTRRPDRARAGDPRFFAWLHHGHDAVALDFASPSGRDELARLIGEADVVIESSRPRALAQLGIDAGSVVARRPGTTWVSITGYGRASNRVAFGDDAAVAAGLVARDDDGLPVFCADAIADPITGLHAAVAALSSIRDGGGHLLDIAMVDAVATTLTTPASPVTTHPVAQPRTPAPC